MLCSAIISPAFRLLYFTIVSVGEKCFSNIAVICLVVTKKFKQYNYITLIMVCNFDFSLSHNDSSPT